MPQPEAKVILEDLGFQVSGAGERAKVTPPSWRPDVEGKADLVEEVIRITGLDRIEPAPLPRLEAAVAKPDPDRDAEAHAAREAPLSRARPRRGGDLVLHRHG